jgi:hypothetical protein
MTPSHFGMARDKHQEAAMAAGTNTGVAERPTAVHEGYQVEIGGPDLVFRSFDLRDTVPTGRQVIEAFTASDPVDFVVFHWQSNGLLEDVGLDEEIDIRARGIERFVVTRSDRIYLLELAGKRQEWALPKITGMTLKRLAGVDPEAFDVFLERRNEPDVEIGDRDTVDLAEVGVERFDVRSRQRQVEIIVNEKPVPIEKGTRTGLEIKQAAINKGLPIKLDFLLSLDEPNGQSKTIRDTDSIKVHTGQVFTAVADDDNS